MVVPASFFHRSNEFTPILLPQLSYICRLFLSWFFPSNRSKGIYAVVLLGWLYSAHVLVWKLDRCFLVCIGLMIFSYAFVGMLLLSTPDENRKRKRKVWRICTIEIKGTRKDDSGEGFVVSKSCSLHLIPRGLASFWSQKCPSCIYIKRGYIYNNNNSMLP